MTDKPNEFVKKLIQEARDAKEFESTLNAYSRVILTSLIQELQAKGIIDEKDVIKRLNAHIEKINKKPENSEIKELAKTLNKAEDYIG